jgi:hypothetical protein
MECAMNAVADEVKELNRLWTESGERNVAPRRRERLDANAPLRPGSYIRRARRGMHVDRCVAQQRCVLSLSCAAGTPFSVPEEKRTEADRYERNPRGKDHDGATLDEAHAEIDCSRRIRELGNAQSHQIFQKTILREA